MWMVRHSRMARPAALPSVIGRMSGVTVGTEPKWATRCIRSPSTRKISVSLAPHTRLALAATASSTGCTSVGDAEMTFRISAVAVC
jgi:hypothetical protein